MTGLSAQSITFAYAGRQPVLRDVTLTPRPGKVTVILGANGAGKTTLLHALAGQLRPDHGVVLLDGQSIDSMSQRQRSRRVALMPQAERRESGMTVRDMVRLGRFAHRGWWRPLNSHDEHVVETAMRRTDTLSIADRAVTAISGGQWRRAILARSLTQDASVLLLDEPTSGLDLKHQYECLEQVREVVRKHQLTAVLSLHDLQQAATFADQVALMSDGRLIAEGDVAKVLTESLIEQAYGIRVTIVAHPTDGRPLVIPSEAIS